MGLMYCFPGHGPTSSLYCNCICIAVRLDLIPFLKTSDKKAKIHKYVIAQYQLLQHRFLKESKQPY